MPLVSVCMAVYKADKFLEPAIKSILQQELRDFEFVIINDGSSAADCEILEKFAQRDQRIRLFHQNNQGLPQAISRAISLAEGKYIARVDADDINLPNRLSFQVECLESNPNLEVVACHMGRIDEFGQQINHAEPYGFSSKKTFRKLRFGNCIPNPSTLVRRSLYVQNPPCRQEFWPAADYDSWLRIVKKNNTVRLNKVVTNYRVHKNQVSTSRFLHQAFMATLAQSASIARNVSEEDLSHIKEQDFSTQRILNLPGLRDKDDILLRRSHYVPGFLSYLKEKNPDLDMWPILEKSQVWRKSYHAILEHEIYPDAIQSLAFRRREAVSSQNVLQKLITNFTEKRNRIANYISDRIYTMGE